MRQPPWGRDGISPVAGSGKGPGPSAGSPTRSWRAGTPRWVDSSGPFIEQLLDFLGIGIPEFQEVALLFLDVGREENPFSDR